MNRALNGTPKPVWRNGRQVGSVQQFDNRLLQFLLKAHRPDLCVDRGHAAGIGAVPRASRPVRDADAAPSP